MQTLRQTFEKELKLKLSQKATAHVPEDIVLIKALKYYDLNNTGYINKEQFSKAMFKLGINFLSQDELDSLFTIYDTDKDSKLDYKDFTSILFANASGITRQMIPIKTNASKGSIDPMVSQALDNLRIKLFKKGILGLLALARQFKNNGYGQKKINFDQFANVLNYSRIDISNRDIETIFKYVDTDTDGYINYEEFIMGLNGPLNTYRKSIIDQAYHKLIKDGRGSLDIQDMKAQFYPSQHPDVKYGRKKESEVLTEFSDSLEAFLVLKDNKSGLLAYKDFEEYNQYLGFFYIEDEYFGDMIQGVWRLNQSYSGKLNQPHYSKNSLYGRNYDDVSVSSYSQSRPQTQSQASRISPTRDEETFKKYVEMLLQRFKSRLSMRGVRGFVGIHRLLRNADTDHDNIISCKELLKVIKDYRLDITEQDTQILYGAFDSENTGRICYEEFLNAIIDIPNQSRKECIKSVFRALDKHNEGTILLKDLKGYFTNCRNHPDVKSSRKTEDQIRDEYYEAIDFTHSLYTDQNDPTVTCEEFERFMSYVSASIDDDKYFEMIVVNVFKIQFETQYSKQFAGMAGGRKDYDPKTAYLQDIHRSYYKGESVTKAAPFGTFDENILNRDKDTRSVSQAGSITPSKSSKTSYASQGINPVYANTYANMGFADSKLKSNTDKIDPNEIFEQLKSKIQSRGLRGMLGLQRMFKVLDLDNRNTLTKDEFSKVLKDFRIELKDYELTSVIEAYELQYNNRINYEDFLLKIRGAMNDTRTEYVDIIFERLDKNGEGLVNIEDIKNAYTGRTHLSVQTGKISEDDAILEFCDTFDLHHNLYLGDFKGRNKKVDLEEFRDYFDYISIDYEDDRKFQTMVNGCWKFDTYNTNNNNGYNDYYKKSNNNNYGDNRSEYSAYSNISKYSSQKNRTSGY